MGADFIGWRSCRLQAELKPEGFLGKLKLRAYKAVVEERVPETERAAIEITVSITGRGQRTLTYPGIVRELAEFERGIPECATCPLARSRPLGCYRYITYPVDEVFEQELFAFFVSQVEQRGTICNQIYLEIIAELEVGVGWYAPRGDKPGSLAALSEPMEHSWIDAGGSEHYLDSAMLLAIAFVSLESVRRFAMYQQLWNRFMERTRSADLAPEQRAALEGSRTVAELKAVIQLLADAAPGVEAEGWAVLADS